MTNQVTVRADAIEARIRRQLRIRQGDEMPVIVEKLLGVFGSKLPRVEQSVPLHLIPDRLRQHKFANACCTKRQNRLIQSP